MFTVVIPTKNRHDFLRQAVGSVLSQSSAAEVIVVDDGAGAAEALAGAGGRIQVLDNGGAGPVVARNRGAAAAETLCIAFLDDDDWFSDRDHLAKAAGAMAAGAALSFADGTLIFDDGRPSLPFTFEADVASLERDNTILISAVSYRRALHATLGPFDEQLPFYWDWDWYLRVARSGGRLFHVREPTVAIRVHGGNMSGHDTAIARRANLDRFAAKHGLAPLALKNHVTIARERAGVQLRK